MPNSIHDILKATAAPKPKAKKPTTSDHTIQNLHRASQKAVALLWGIHPRTVRKWKDVGLPRNDDGSYDLPTVIAWWQERYDEDIAMATGAGPDEHDKAVTRWRVARANIAELEYQTKRSELIPRDEMHDLIARLATLLRNAGDDFQRTLPEAADRLIQVLETFDREVAQLKTKKEI